MIVAYQLDLKMLDKIDNFILYKNFNLGMQICFVSKNHNGIKMKFYSMSPDKIFDTHHAGVPNVWQVGGGWAAGLACQWLLMTIFVICVS